MRGAHELRHRADLALGASVVPLPEAAVRDAVRGDCVHDLSCSRDSRETIGFPKDDGEVERVEISRNRMSAYSLESGGVGRSKSDTGIDL